MQEISQSSGALRMPNGEMISMLGQDPEPLLEWLQRPRPQYDRKKFFDSRTVYYPGPGFDVDPVKLCAQANAAHTFLYVDNGVSLENIRNVVHKLENWGYEVEREDELTDAVLLAEGWTPHVHETDLAAEVEEAIKSDFVGIYVVLRRDVHHDQSHGPKRLALLYVIGDGHITYDAFYCQEDDTPAPYLIVVQDHGPMAMNHSGFERGGLLERLAYQGGQYPRWLLVGSVDAIGNRCKPWTGYIDTGVEPEPQGAVGNPRKLYRRDAHSQFLLTRQSLQMPRNETTESISQPTLALMHEVHDILKAQGNDWMRLQDVANCVNERALFQSRTGLPVSVTTDEIFMLQRKYRNLFERRNTRIRCAENG